MTGGWGRRSKKRPKRTDSTGEASVAADLERGTLEPATPTPTREITPPNEITRADSQEGARLQDIYPANDNALYHLHHAPQDGRTPESTNPSPPELERPDSPRYYPRTLVNGVYYVHDPSSLPQPLGQGYLAWASLEHEAARRPPPRRSGESRWNNRTLRYWHLSTDFSRFKEDNEDDGPTEEGPTRVNKAMRTGNGDFSQPSIPIRGDSTPQRPYTAPPHTCEE